MEWGVWIVFFSTKNNSRFFCFCAAGGMGGGVEWGVGRRRREKEREGGEDIKYGSGWVGCALE